MLRRSLRNRLLHPQPLNPRQHQPKFHVPCCIRKFPLSPRSARESIHGHIKVTVRVAVDRSGAVVSEAVEEPGSSKYFARVASEAARKWRFAPADDQNSREWLLRFEFGRDGTTARAASPRS